MNGTKVVATLATLSVANPGFALDLVGAYRRAMTHDPTIAAADDALRAGREKAVQGRALLLPQVQLSTSVTQISDRTSTSNLPPQVAAVAGSGGSGRLHEVALELKQPIVDAGARASKGQLQVQSDLSELQRRDAQQDLMRRVAEAYFQVLLAEETLRVTVAQKAAVGMQRDRSQARFDVGRGRITEVQESQARYDGVLSREVRAESALALARTQFEETTGASAVGLSRPAARFTPTAPQPDSAGEWQRRAVEGNVHVLTKRAEVAIAGFEIDKYRLGSRPTLDLVAGTSYNRQSGGLSELTYPDGRRAAAVGLQLRIPLYAGGGISSRERESIARHGQAEHEVAAAERDARVRAQDAYLEVKTGVTRIAALEQAVRSAATAVEATTLGRDVGSRTELDVLDAEQRLATARLDLAQARNDYLLGRIRLAASAGTLAEADLVAVSALLAS